LNTKYISDLFKSRLSQSVSSVALYSAHTVLTSYNLLQNSDNKLDSALQR